MHNIWGQLCHTQYWVGVISSVLGFEALPIEAIMYTDVHKPTRPTTSMTASDQTSNIITPPTQACVDTWS